MQASPDTTAGVDAPVGALTTGRRYQIATADLQVGMFVAELDRPWLDTPFLLQGFVADSQVEIDTLRKYCSYVYIDLESSHPDVAGAIRQAEVGAGDRGAGAAAAERAGGRGSGRATPLPAGSASSSASGSNPASGSNSGSASNSASASASGSSSASADGRSAPRPAKSDPAAEPTVERRRAGSGRSYRSRADVRISSGTRQRFRELLRNGGGDHAPKGSLFGRLLTWLRGHPVIGAEPDGARPSPVRDRATRDAVKAWLPADVPLTEYPEVRDVEQELPRARTSLARAEDVLKSLVGDVKTGRIPQITEVSAAVDDMVSSMVDNPDALLWIGRLRDEDVNTYNHGVKVALYLIALGRQLGLPKQQLSHLGMIGMLADVGKIRLPRALLDKPGMLAPQEYELIKKHVRLGLEALRKSGPLPPEIEQGIAQHHERLDGSGYPRGLKGGEISIYGRMAAIADSFSALITPRAYANALAPQDALMNLYEWAGTSFHEPLIEQFVQAIGVFPVGSLVELSSGEVAIVVAHNRVRRLEPKVLVLTWPDKTPLARPIERDLLKQSRTASVRLRIVRGLAAGAYGLKLRDYYMGEIARANELPA